MKLIKLNNNATEPHNKLDAPRWATLIQTSNFVHGFRAPKIIWVKIIDNENIDSDVNEEKPLILTNEITKEINTTETKINNNLSPSVRKIIAEKYNALIEEIYS